MFDQSVWKTLSENHRRALLSLISHMHGKLIEAKGLITNPSNSPMDDFVSNLSEEKKSIGLAGIERIDELLEETFKKAQPVSSKIKNKIGALEALQTRLSFLLITLDGNSSKRLLGYGRLSDLQRSEIDSWVKSLAHEIERLKNDLKN